MENMGKIAGKRLKSAAGVTLVELLVAAVIILVVVIGVVAVVRKSGEMQTIDYHRRQARSIATSILETQFHWRTFPGPYNVELKDEDMDPVPVLNDPVEVIIDRRDGNFEPLKGLMTVNIDRGWIPAANVNANFTAFTSGPPPTSAVNPVIVHNITVRIDWTDISGQPDHVELTKQLAGVP
jgi:hypothetical protein